MLGRASSAYGSVPEESELEKTTQNVLKSMRCW